MNADQRKVLEDLQEAYYLFKSPSERRNADAIRAVLEENKQLRSDLLEASRYKAKCCRENEARIEAALSPSPINWVSDKEIEKFWQEHSYEREELIELLLHSKKQVEKMVKALKGEK